LGIPYTGSRVLTNAIALDKTITKRLWREQNLPTPAFQEFASDDMAINAPLHYPLFVKPAKEGTGMGINERAIVKDEGELRKRITWVLNNYNQPALVEEYLPGREFTVAVLGRSGYVIQDAHHPELFNSSGFHRFPILEIDTIHAATPKVYGYLVKSIDIDGKGAPDYLCPADIDLPLAEELQVLALKAHESIGAVDISRVDIRLDQMGKPHLIEINALPGLNPELSDVCIMAKAEGLEYQDLILEILYLGAARYGMVHRRMNTYQKPVKKS
jgi:D-alanine-D-alanine ligase